MRWFFGMILSLILSVGGVASAQSGPPNYITFVSDTTNDHNEDIFVINALGNNLYNLTNNAARDWHPTWSPDGLQIAFISNRDGSADIFLMDANGNNQRSLLTTPGVDEGAPAWSPDGERIAYVAPVDGVLQIFSLALGSPQPEQLTDDAAPKGAPAWSPDGRQVAFWRVNADDPSITEIVVVDRISLNETVVIAEGNNNWPAFSPSGEYLAFFRVQNEVAKLYAVDFRTDLEFLLSDAALEASDLQPAWSLDGGQLAFTSNRDGGFQVFTQVALGAVTGFGAFPRRLVQLDGNTHSPDWQPTAVSIDFANSSARSMGLSQRVVTGELGEANDEIDSGQLTIYAPETMQGDEVITVRLELKSNLLLAREAQGETVSLAPETAPRERMDTVVYEFMGAELQGFDIAVFDSFPAPSGYVIAVDPEAVNYWEWQLRPVNADIRGRKDLMVIVYLPQENQNGTQTRVELLRETFSVNIVGEDAVAAAPTAQPAPEGVATSRQTDFGIPVLSPRVVLVYSPDMFSIVILDTIDLAGITITTARREASIIAAFDVLQLSSVATPSMCLHFVRFGVEVPVPSECNERQNFRRELGNDRDIFWYDRNQARVLDSVVRAGETHETLALCAGSSQDGCQF